MTTTKESLRPFRLKTQYVKRVWGRRDLSPWYEQRFEEPVGEAWLTGEDCQVDGGPYSGQTLGELSRSFAGELSRADGSFPLLIKMLFPQEKLSVQVHPDDEQARALEGDARAKTECWYVLAADPGASVSLGLKQGTNENEVRQALGEPAFEALLNDLPVAVGDMIYVEAGTVHAIGGGLVALEVQQPSDTTYRLYDYGRPRELHLDAGMKVLKLQTASGKQASQPLLNGERLIETRYFVVERFDLPEGGAYRRSDAAQPECLIGLGGDGVLIAGEDRIDLLKGQAVVIPAGCPKFHVEGTCSFVRCYAPA